MYINNERSRVVRPDKKKLIIVLISLLVINLIITAFIAFYIFIPTEKRLDTDRQLVFNSVQNGQYVLYIGTNDKDTYEQIIPTAQAQEIVNNICVKYVDGYTASEAQGGWIDENGILTQETTLVYTFTGAEEAEIISIMNEILIALNQNSILVEKRDVFSTFYNGKNN